MKQPTPDAHWRDSARSVRFFMWDGSTAFPLLILLIYPRWWTLIVAVLTMTFFSILMRYGLTVGVFFRWLRSAVAGRRKFSPPWWDK
jgi:intracellular multiplication protein IcmT